MSAARPWYAGTNGAEHDARRYFVVRDGRLGPEYFEGPNRKIAFFRTHAAAAAKADQLNTAATS